MVDKLASLGPEIAMLIGACLCMVIGLMSEAANRRWTVAFAGLTLVIAGVLAYPVTKHAAPAGDEAESAAHAATVLKGMGPFVKVAVAFVGLLLLMLSADLPDRLAMTRQAAQDAEAGKSFDAGNVVRGEFFAFFLVSLTGVMLCAEATDLVWLFLALELTSLPTYVLVSVMRDRLDAREAGVKYFFLGALAAAVFLYGFALIYGATGTTVLFSANPEIASVAGFVQERLTDGGSLPPLFIAGVMLAVVGIGFKIAAFPMHFYAADVYQGAALPITAFLAFVPKTAGFVAMALVLQASTGGVAALPAEVATLVAVMAAVTMTWGNVMGLLQRNLKRVLAFSSIAHSGYMLVGLLAVGGSAVAAGGDVEALGSGAAAVLFYLVAYGLSNLAAFAVLGAVSDEATAVDGKVTTGDEAVTYDDLRGLSRRRPFLAATMLIAVLSLIGLPPMIGFLGKVYLFGSAIDAGFIALVVVAVVNSAISAVYYLRIAAACFFGDASESTDASSGDAHAGPAPSLMAYRLSGAVAAVASVVLGLAGGWLVDSAKHASAFHQPPVGEHRVQPVSADPTASPQGDAVVEPVDAGNGAATQKANPDARRTTPRAAPRDATHPVSAPPTDQP